MLEKLKRIANYFPYCLTIVDVQSKGRPCLFANEKFFENTGYNGIEAVGRNLSYLQGELTSEDTILFMRKCFDQNVSCIQDVINYKKDGTPFLNRLLMLPILSKSKTLFYVGFQNDITLSRGLNYNDESLKRVKDQEIRHMVNNPLTVILGKFELAFRKANSQDEIDKVAQELSNEFERINDYALNIKCISQFENFDPYTFQPKIG